MSIVEMSVRKRTKREQEAFDMGCELGRREATRYGRWVPCGFGKEIMCSVCRCEIDDGWQYRYCPDCGAKMDVTDINVGSKDGGAE